MFIYMYVRASDIADVLSRIALVNSPFNVVPVWYLKGGGSTSVTLPFAISLIGNACMSKKKKRGGEIPYILGLLYKINDKPSCTVHESSEGLSSTYNNPKS